MTVAASMTLQEVARREWPVLVIGAGPTGSFLARELRRAGVEVLLVDRSEFPRWKVCGCCLNGAALSLLEEAGLGNLLPRCGAVALNRVNLAAGSGTVTLRLPAGAALSRESLDSALIRAAVDEGVTFLPGTMARVGREAPGHRQVTLSSAVQGETVVTARIVVVADGLSGLSLTREPGHRVLAQRHSRIGAGAVAARAPDWVERGAIYMYCGTGGYVGAVRLEDGRLDVAAALDPQHVRRHGNLGTAVSAILRERKWPGAGVIATLSWRGTPLLSRRAEAPAGERYFIVGDAAGYVEPFTGEGIAWGLVSAAALSSLVRRAVRDWQPSLIQLWQLRLCQLLTRRRVLCRLLTLTLRSPLLSSALVRLLRLAPIVARPFLLGLNRPLHSRLSLAQPLDPAILTP
jgi:2-polyprenyl-6-methoxyphenol hydroxylase-like FAD-dependent oxidoreductase